QLYFGYPLDPDRAFCWADSNGCAAGNTREEAILQGFLEDRLRSEEHTSELQSLAYLVCRLLLEKKNVPSFVSDAMAKAGTGLIEGTLPAGTSAVSDTLLDLVGLSSTFADDIGQDTRDYLPTAFP